MVVVTPATAYACRAYCESRQAKPDPAKRSSADFLLSTTAFSSNFLKGVVFMNRRDFLKSLSAGTLGCGLAPLGVFSGDSAQSKCLPRMPGFPGCGGDMLHGHAFSATDTASYDPAEILKGYDQWEQTRKDFFAVHYGDRIAAEMITEMRKEYESLIPAIPYIGENNSRLNYLIPAVVQLAHYSALKKFEVTLKEFYILCMEPYRDYIYSSPERNRHVSGYLYCKSKLLRSMFKNNINQTQEHLYEGDWVGAFVEGDGVEFDWGIDYTECGICKFYQSQGETELLPWLCKTDFIQSKAYNTGYTRAKTLAAGDAVCDMRWQWDRAVEIPY